MNARAVAVGVAIVIVIGGFVGFISFEAEIVEASGGSILYVGGTGGGNYSTIQEAIDAASPGDTVFVYSGTYYENIIINKTINLIGEDKDATIINGSGLDNVISVKVDWVNITSFTIIGSGTSSWHNHGIELYEANNCSILNINCVGNGGGILLYQSSENIIKNNDIFNNTFGISIGSYYVKNNKIMFNNIFNNSNGILICNPTMPGPGKKANSGHLIYQNCIYNNSKGIFLNVMDAGSIDDVEIASNSIFSNDIGIEFENRGWRIFNTIISNCSIENNRVGILMDQIYWSNFIISNNFVNNNEYGIELNNSVFNYILQNNLINNNNGGFQGFDNLGANFWNDSYPSGGNYWSDYAGVDLYKGPNQDQSGSDGIGDSPHNKIGGIGMQDHYPFMSPFIIKNATIEVPSVPVNLNVSAGNGHINLAWEPPESKGNLSIIKYNIFKSNISGSEIFYTETGKSLFFNDTNVVNGEPYYYKVSAQNGFGEGPLSNEINATPKGLSLSPWNLKPTTGNGYVNLSWQPPISNEGSVITNYKIYRGNASGSLTLFTLIGNQLFYNDTNVTNGLTYYYQVSAVNAVGEGPRSNEVNATPIRISSISPTIIINNDWALTGTEAYINETIILNGNLTIENGGCLTFKNVTLLINCSANGTYHIEVNNGGTFYIYDYDNNSTTIKDTSNITSYFSDGKHRYGFWVQEGAKFEMHNSVLRECGWTYPWTYYDFKIAGLYINTNNAIIENCLISNNYYGIFLNGSDSNIISNNTITESIYAIRCHLANNNSIYGNNLSNNSAGSFFTFSNYNQFHNNSLNNNYIAFDSSHYNDISNNDLKNSGGIRFKQSKDNKLNNNLISLDNPYGINLQYSTNHELTNNKMINNGIKIWGHLPEHWDSHIINNSNTVNGKPVIYWKNRNDEVVPQEAGQIILASCSNIYIEKFNINNVSCAVQFGFSNDIIIRDNNFSNNHDGIVFMYSSNNIIENNICNSNRDSGIHFTESSVNTITNNTCNYNQYSGIKLSYCDNNIISNNNCKINNFNGIELYYSVENTVSENYVALNNRNGIQIQGYYTNVVIYNTAAYNNDSGIAVYNSDRCEIINNNVSLNNYSGIYNTGSDDNIIANNYALLNNKFGICVTDSNYLNISKNYLKDSDYGIFFMFSSWCTIYNNILSNNGIGIEINQSDGNTLYYNNFISNSQQAFDNSNNQWDNGVSRGNYWSDYTGVDANGDGLGDTPYIIDDDSQDNYPLMEPWNLTIQEPTDIIITLELDKTEFYLNETISGSIHITNENPFDIALNDLPWQIMVGIFFNITALDDNTYIDSVYNRAPIEVDALSTLTIAFELYEMNTLSPEASGSLYLHLPVGNYTIFSYFYYGSSTEYEILESNPVNFRILDNPPPTPGSNGNGDNGDSISGTDDYTTTIIFASTAGLVLFIIIISIFISGTEIGKYKFASMFVAPLYSRDLKRRRRKGKELYLRGKIHGYILGNPGENYTALKTKLSLTNGALAYHLKVLERNKDVRSERDGVLKRFYPYEGKITAEILELSRLQKRILRFIKQTPGISQTDLSKKLNESVQRVNYHVLLMVEARLIKLERDGNKTKCFIVD